MDNRDKGPILLVAAHPDDETIGAGIRLTRWMTGIVTIVHLTDGSPRDLSFAQAAGFETGEEYAHERRRELYCALDLAGIRPDQCFQFKYPDQEACENLPEITDRLAALIHQLKPSAIYTHPYEGGHPDHDAAAFAVAHVARENVFEFTSYHAGPEGLVSGEFLGGGPFEKIEPTEEERAMKERMFQCFRSQQNVLSRFSIGPERFRPAPDYDFSEPPHAGLLHYETLGWNISGEKWRDHANRASQLLGR